MRRLAAAAEAIWAQDALGGSAGSLGLLVSQSRLATAGSRPLRGFHWTCCRYHLTASSPEFVVAPKQKQRRKH